MQGWIKLHRQVRDNWIWNDPIKFQWWIDMLLMVNHADTKVNIGLELYECNRGQSILSLRSWGQRWKVSKDTVRNFFVLLEKDKMVLAENLKKTTRITICNYDNYQSSLHDEQTVDRQKADRKQTVSHPNKNQDNINNENNHIITTIQNMDKENSFNVLWDLYDKKVGDKLKLSKKWTKLSELERLEIIKHVEAYKVAVPQKQYRKNLETYLNNKSWNDEIIESSIKKTVFDKTTSTNNAELLVEYAEVLRAASLDIR